MMQYRDASASEPEDGSAPTDCLGYHFALAGTDPRTSASTADPSITTDVMPDLPAGPNAKTRLPR